MKEYYLEIKNGKLKELRPVLKKWIKITKQFSEDFKNDALYWYNERASLSVFAGAVWLSGGSALEEFSSTKGLHGNEWKGRKDLWFCFKQQEYIAEVKFLYQSFSLQNKNMFDRMKQSLEEACSDAKKSKEKNKFSLGLSFIVPHLPKSKEKDIENLIDKLQNKLLTIDCDLLAWIFPTGCRDLSYTDDNVKTFYPGGIVIGKIS